MLTHKGTQTLKTERLILRKFVLSDSEEMFTNYASDSRVTRFLSWTPYKKVDDVKKFLEEIIYGYSNDNLYHWAIEFNKTIIGSISAIVVNEKNCSWEIGYCIGYDFWNKGIISEALKAIIKFMLYDVNMHRIVAKHDVENIASGKVMQKCGMIYEARLKEYYKRHDGTFSVSIVYRMLHNEYSPM